MEELKITCSKSECTLSFGIPDLFSKSLKHEGFSF